MTNITELAQRTDLLMDNALETAKQLRELSESTVADAIFESIVENENGKEIQFERPISDLAYAAFLKLERLVEALEKAQKSNAFLKGQLSELANFNPDWDKLEASYESWREIAAELLVAKERIAELEEAERKLCAANVTLDARAEQAERERENWRTSFDNERFRADKLKAHIDEMTEERTASINELSRIIQREIKAKREAEQRIAELEREREHLRPVGVMSEKAYHRLENSECRFIALWPRPGIFLPRKRPVDGVIVYARTAAAAGIKVEAE